MLKKYILVLSLGVICAANAQENCTKTIAGNNVGDKGCVTLTYQNKNVSYTTVRAADGNEWLQQNLGSSKVAASIDDEAARGDYFQYGRWDDGHQLKDSEMSEEYPTPNNPLGLGNGNKIFYINGGSPWTKDYTGWFANPLQNDTWSARSLKDVTANNGMDPCSAIGENWEMPSEADWNNVMTKENIFPRPQGSTNNGITRAFNSNLKIAGAGSRKNETFAFEGTRAYIWTKTASSNPDFYRYVYLGIAPTSSTGFGGDAKSYGYSVRCINKSQNLGVDLVNKVNDLKISPNPTDKFINVQSSQEISNIKIINTNGQVVLETKTTTINVEKFSAGIYFMTIELKNGGTENKKFIKK